MFRISHQKYTRRAFMRSGGAGVVGLATSGALVSPAFIRTLTYAALDDKQGGEGNSNPQRVRFGVIADLHHGLQPDANDRLTPFIDESIKRADQLDFIIQLGDFCHPTLEAKTFVDNYNRFTGKKHHVLGNHDMDKGTKDDSLKLWGMRSPYYSFDVGPYHFVILDLNHIKEDDSFIDYDNANFYIDGAKRAWAGPDQLEWLAADLKATDKPTIIFSHQPVVMVYPGNPMPPQRAEINEIIYKANKEAEDSGQKVIACIFSHQHIDHTVQTNGIHAVCINSASYHWARGWHPNKDPLFAFVTLSTDGKIEIEGKTSEFVNKHLHEQGLNTKVPGIPGVRVKNLRFQIEGSCKRLEPVDSDA